MNDVSHTCKTCGHGCHCSTQVKKKGEILSEICESCTCGKCEHVSHSDW